VHPKSGPYGIDAATDPTNPKAFVQPIDSPSATVTTAVRSIGQRVDLRV
jgi:hypothetical protein